MNRWAKMLGDLPAGLQRAIARSQRISLPRRHDAGERLRRLRDANSSRDKLAVNAVNQEQSAGMRAWQVSCDDRRSRRLNGPKAFTLFRSGFMHLARF